METGRSRESLATRESPDQPNDEWGESTVEFEPHIQRSKMGPEIADYLRGRIMSGRLVPGERLRLKDLAERLSVSTTPVREALLMLTKEGLVEAEHHRGFRVRKLKAQDIRDIFELHAVISGMLAERAATALSDEELNSLTQINEHLRAAVERGEAGVVERDNHRFHRMIDKSHEAVILHRFLGELTRYVPHGYFEQIPGWLQSSYEDHVPILEALRARDGTRARAAAETHMRTAGGLLADYLITRFKAREAGATAPGDDG